MLDLIQPNINHSWLTLPVRVDRAMPMLLPLKSIYTTISWIIPRVLISKFKIWENRAVVVAQLLEESLPTPKVRSSNPITYIIEKFS